MNFDLHKLDKLKGAKGAGAPKAPSKFAPRLLPKQASGQGASPPRCMRLPWARVFALLLRSEPNPWSWRPDRHPPLSRPPAEAARGCAADD